MPSRSKLLEELSERIGQRHRAQIQRALHLEEDRQLEGALREWEDLYAELRKQGKDISPIQDHIQRVHTLLWQRKGSQKRDEPSPGPSQQERGTERFADFKKMFQAEVEERCAAHGAGPCVGGEEARSRVRNVLDQVVKENLRSLPDWISRRELIESIVSDMCGLGVLEEPMSDPAVRTILVNGVEVFCERDGRMRRLEHLSPTPLEAKKLAERVVSMLVRKPGNDGCLVEGKLGGGSWVEVVLPPVALDGPLIAIRKPPPSTPALSAWAGEGPFSTKVESFLRLLATQRRNVVIAGERGSGKTALLDLLCRRVPQDERIVAIEDVAELNLDEHHAARMEARGAGSGREDLSSLVQKGLRMWPHRLVLGDCRGAEVARLIEAAISGFAGILVTITATSVGEALTRLETMAALDLGASRPDVVRRLIARAWDVLIFCTRFPGGLHRITQVCELVADERDSRADARSIFAYERVIGAEDGRLGTFRTTGYVPGFVSQDPGMCGSGEILGLFAPEVEPDRGG
ncbi:MAG: ATPase, T2SS/T4P/T4SS family [bacterium]